MVEIIIAGVFTIGTSLMAYALGKEKNKADLSKTEADTLKTREETEKLRIDNSIEKLELVDKLMAKIDSMQKQIDELQETINKLEYEKCKGDSCPTRIEYNILMAKKAARKKYSKKPKEIE